MRKVNLKAAGRKVVGTTKNVAALLVASLAAGAAVELSFVGTQMAINDVELTGKKIAEKLDRKEPVYYKEGLFGKKQVGVIGKDGNVKPYKGNKVPASKKAVRV